MRIGVSSGSKRMKYSRILLSHVGGMFWQLQTVFYNSMYRVITADNLCRELFKWWHLGCGNKGRGVRTWWAAVPLLCGGLPGLWETAEEPSATEVAATNEESRKCCHSIISNVNNNSIQQQNHQQQQKQRRWTTSYLPNWQVAYQLSGLPTSWQARPAGHAQHWIITSPMYQTLVEYWDKFRSALCPVGFLMCLVVWSSPRRCTVHTQRLIYEVIRCTVRYTHRLL